jgi:O-antigen/teichoic acid export membrane protein
MAVKTAHAALAFSIAVVLARALGSEGYGVYSFALAIIMLTAVPAQVGIPQLVVRETAKAHSRECYGLMRGMWSWGTKAVLLFSAIALLVMGLFVWLTGFGSGGARSATLSIGFILIPIIALANVQGACLRGLRKVVQGQLSDRIIRPATLLLLALISSKWLLEDQLIPQTAMKLHAIAAGVAFIFGFLLLHSSRPIGLTAGPSPKYNRSAWRKAAFPLALVSAFHLINSYADLLILGMSRSDAEVGIYRATFQVSLLVVFGLQAINQVLQPHFSRLYWQGELVRLQKLVTASARIILLLALPPVLLFVAFGEDLLGWIFGKAFQKGATTLTILSLGQITNAAMGSVAILLNMTGNEKATMRTLALATLINVILNFALIPRFGMLGAAISTATTLIASNIFLRFEVIKRTGIETLASGPLKRTRPGTQ